MLGRIERREGRLEDDLAWLLLDELSHRVGNEFMAVLAALHVARRGIRDIPDLARDLDQAAVRLENFCKVNRILDRNCRYESLRARLDALCRATAQSKPAAQDIRIILDGDDVAVDDETAWTVCVVASELITNALKHAFCADRRGELRVSLRADHDNIVLTVDDTGARPPTRLAAPIPAGIGVGSGIVADLAGRLRGVVTRRSDPAGTLAVLTLPVRRAIQ